MNFVKINKALIKRVKTTKAGQSAGICLTIAQFSDVAIGTG